jgi:hypothetical protein
MKDHAAPSYNQLSQALAETTFKLHPSQVHGVICGILCGSPNNDGGWEKWITGQKETQEARNLLDQIYAISAKHLHDFLFEFELLLPLDTAALPERAEALTLWCQGFLTGLKLTDIPIENRKTGEVTEAIDDLIEIAKMNYEDVVASSEDEQAYMELVEYVRMAVILIYQDLQETEEKSPADDNASSSNPLH